jgi:hypothetical protein
MDSGVAVLIDQYAHETALDVVHLQAGVSRLGESELADHARLTEGIGIAQSQRNLAHLGKLIENSDGTPQDFDRRARAGESGKRQDAGIECGVGRAGHAARNSQASAIDFNAALT